MAAGEIGPDRLKELEEHRASCSACAEYERRMRETLRAVTPLQILSLPEGFDERLHMRLRERRMRGRVPHSRIVWQVSAVAALVIAGLFVGLGIGGPSPAHAAASLFCQGQQTMGSTAAVEMEMQVRTLPDDNFAYIDPKAGFVPHVMRIRYGSPTCWRMEKPGRVACCDGERQYMWAPATGSGWIFDQSGSALEDFALLIDPRLLLSCEEAISTERNPGVKYVHTTEGGSERIVVSALAQRVNDAVHARLGHGIDERDSRREYTFDKLTGRLTGFRVLVLDDGKEVPVVETTRIDYDVPLEADSLVARPAGDAIAWIDLTRIDCKGGLTDMTADEAARRIVAAFGNWDRLVLDKAMPYYPLELVKSRYAGAELVEVESPFRSGTYAGVFVPCQIRQRDGQVVSLRLALRNDNPEKAWVVDGGI